MKLTGRSKRSEETETGSGKSNMTHEDKSIKVKEETSKLKQKPLTGLTLTNHSFKTSDM